jgi:uncharacterized repeat protein (TIGR03803 family)
MAALEMAAQEQVLYRFKGSSDGYYPAASLLQDQDGEIYGTTSEGGNGKPCGGNSYPQGCGTVFELMPPAQSGEPWSETVLYRFQGGSDGYAPGSALIADPHGNLYSTTAGGGYENNGTVFELEWPSSPGGAWKHHVLYAFKGVPNGNGEGDASLPGPILFDAAGNLYGTADWGGFCTNYQGLVNCNGAVFKVEPPGTPGGAWTESVLHRFGNSGDANPHGGVILDKAGNFYGTTYIGGDGFGGIFELSPSGDSWSETTLFNFNNRNGGVPNDSLVFDSAGNLYGTTLQGGPANAGTVFELAASGSTGEWTETVLHNFQSGGDGNSPLANVIFDKAGNLYSTTWQGGSQRQGTAFRLTPPVPPNTEWTETILHSFGSGADGRQPGGGLIFGRDGALYGTAETGGSTAESSACLLDDYAFTCGVVFRILP